MIAQVAAVSFFTMLIHLAETLTYSLRLAGVRLRKLAVAMSLSGIVLLISRTSNMIQAPMTGKIIDGARLHPDFHLAGQMRFILAAATAGTLLAIVLFPTAVRLSARLIAHMEQAGSIPRLLPVLLSPTKMRNIRYYLRLPRFSMFSHIRKGGVPYRLVLLNGLVTAIYTIGGARGAAGIHLCNGLFDLGFAGLGTDQRHGDDHARPSDRSEDRLADRPGHAWSPVERGDEPGFRRSDALPPYGNGVGSAAARSGRLVDRMDRLRDLMRDLTASRMSWKRSVGIQ
ncbi:lipid II flippase family protein [Paenibacillus sp. D9]|uniref:lipid II flippase family protein n=1 Tax=Paenibacillus sp. D9 TaxID=665792 RepID=UPI000A5C92DB